MSELYLLGEKTNSSQNKILELYIAVAFKIFDTALPGLHQFYLGLEPVVRNVAVGVRASSLELMLLNNGKRLAGAIQLISIGRDFLITRNPLEVFCFLVI